MMHTQQLPADQAAVISAIFCCESATDSFEPTLAEFNLTQNIRRRAARLIRKVEMILFIFAANVL